MPVSSPYVFCTISSNFPPAFSFLIIICFPYYSSILMFPSIFSSKSFSQRIPPLLYYHCSKHGSLTLVYLYFYKSDSLALDASLLIHFLQLQNIAVHRPPPTTSFILTPHHKQMPIGKLAYCSDRVV